MPTVSTLTVDLVARTASFEGPMSQAAAAGKKTAKDIQSAFNNMDFGQGRGGLMVLDDLLGVHLPRHVTTLVASLPGIQQAMAIAFPAFAVIEVGKAIDQLVEKHKAMTDALYGQGAVWDGIRDTASKFADQTKIKLLELQIKIDDFTKGPLSSLGAKLALIDAQTMDQLKGEFDSLEKVAKKAFADMEESGFKAFLFHEGGAQKGIKNVADNFDQITASLKSMEKAGDMPAIGQFLDQQIQKTKDLIKTDQTWAGTGSTAQIVAANQRLLTVLNDLKEAYTGVASIQEKSKASQKNEQVQIGFKVTETNAGQQLAEQLANIDRLKSAAVLAFTETGITIDEAKAKADVMFGSSELQAHLDYFDRLVKAGGSFEDRIKVAAEQKIFLDKQMAQSSESLAAIISKNNQEIAKLDENSFKEGTRINQEGQKEQMALVDAKVKAMLQVISLTRAETDEEAKIAAMQQVHTYQRIADIGTEIKELQKLRQAAIEEGRDVLAYDAAIATAQKKRQQDLANELIATGKFANVWRGTMMQMEMEWSNVSGRISSLARQTFEGMTVSLSTMVVEGQGNWRQLAATAIESLIQIEAQHLLGFLIHETIEDKKKLSDAKSAARGAYSATSDIPIVGPFLAPLAAAGAFAAVMAFRQGGIVPTDAMALVHQNEMVLPQHISNFIMNAAGSSSGGGQVHHHHNVFAPNIQAVDAAGVDRVMDKHMDRFIRKMGSAVRRRNYN